MKCRVHFSGFAYVEADNMEEAEDMFLSDNTTYSDTGIDMIEEVDEFEIEL